MHQTTASCIKGAGQEHSHHKPHREVVIMVASSAHTIHHAGAAQWFLTCAFWSLCFHTTHTAATSGKRRLPTSEPCVMKPFPWLPISCVSLPALQSRMVHSTYHRNFFTLTSDWQHPVSFRHATSASAVRHTRIQLIRVPPSRCARQLVYCCELCGCATRFLQGPLLLFASPSFLPSLSSPLRSCHT